jgi:hypothetical protein
LRWTLIATLGVACAGRSTKDEVGAEHGGAGGSSGGMGAASGGVATLGGNAGRGVAGSGGALGLGGGSAGIGGQGGTGYSLYPCGDLSAWSPNVERCTSGALHHPEPKACPLPARDGGDEGGFGGVPEFATCTSDQGCAEHAYCMTLPSPQTSGESICRTACASDSDCATGSICICENFRKPDGGSRFFGVCVSADCRGDADCQAGFDCVAPPFAEACGTEPEHFACQTSADRCGGPSDCKTGDNCELSNGSYQCVNVGICGRPFLVGGVARRAGSLPRADWLDARGALPEPCESPAACALEDVLSAAERRTIAEHWLDVAALEHASIAAFARFTLELLAIGAPHELVQASARAMSDETEHAREAYGLAARYAGRARGPAPLDVNGVLDGVELLDVVERAVLEGCVGETAAALEARWAADSASDARVRRVLSRIAEDETRHAVLAFEFVAWAAERDRRVPALVARVLGEVRSDAARPQGEPRAPGSERLEQHGVLGAELRRAARQATLERVVPAVRRALERRAEARARAPGWHAVSERA